MPSNPIDSHLLKDQFGTEAMRAIFSDEKLLQNWLDAEVALARAEANLKLIPEEAADEISQKAVVANMDFETIRKGIKETSHPLITVIRELEKVCEGDAGGYVHWGATTQDIIDTGLALQVKEAHQLLLDQANALLNVCLKLSEEHKSTMMPGRTHGQHALPITFGYKVSIWADEIGRHIERMEQAGERYLVGQFGGAAGTLASLGDKGLDVQKEYNRLLGLKQPTVTWHAARDHYAEFSMIVAMLSATTAKIANEIINLQRTEIGELEEGFEMGKVGSSTMPHKRNPMICEYIVSLSHVVRRKASLGLDCMIQEHERDMAFWQTEWSYLPEVCILTSGGLDQLQGVLENLIVHKSRMEKNVYITKGLIVSENVMLGLGKYVGRQKAHDIIYEASMRAYEEDRPLEAILLENEELLAYMDEKTIQTYTNPATYLGLCETFVERVLQKWRTVSC
ncbi:adenylosuccinate lyase [Shouchella rhizosphaerae]|uniref:adenylosuccinate lyase n=1 Tax=Shouchella rhizosphaerae TaxID=866786 RepID=UPI003F7E767D